MQGSGRRRTIAQWEKLLLVLLSGQVVTPEEIQTLLKTELVWNRFSTYLWDMKKSGALIKKTKQGKKIVGYQLENVDAMRAYAVERGLIAPPPTVLSQEDLLVTSGV